MEFFDVTDDFISEKPGRAKKTGSKAKIKFISDDGIETNFGGEKTKPRELPARRKDPARFFTNLSPSMRKILLSVTGFLILAVLICAFFLYSASFKKTWNARPLSDEQLVEFDALLDARYPEKRVSILKELPYPVSKANLDVWAGSAILIDASNGCVLFEKNADQIIPPASIAKLFVMYIVFKDVAEGKISLDDIVPLPERSWAVNMPKDASLMFLGQGQVITLRELLKGLAVASGNDAALAVADYISGSTKAFVERMNEECASLGLTSTRFVEPSGYDENNLSTARELAAFCREYIKRFPQSVEEFHSAPSIRYPLEKNLPPWLKNLGDSAAIYQKNTNPLLGVLEGCDGIKTGFIYESRYNLALTAKRNGVRYISVTMMGTGSNTKQGNEGRVHDGTQMMEWAFSAFADFDPTEDFPQSYPVPALGSKNTDGKFVRLVPAWSNTLTVPNILGEDAVSSARNVRAMVNIPKFIYGGVKQGEAYGQIQYRLGDAVLEIVPLVADRSYERAGFFGRVMGKLVSWRF